MLAALLLVVVASCEADPTGRQDSTAAINKCFEANPSGNLLIPAGRYKIAGTLVKNRRQNLIGAGAKASIFACESLQTPCLVAADTSGGPGDYSVSSIERIGFEGKGGGVGIYLGGDPSGRINSRDAFGDFVQLVEVRITGFQHGVEWGNNAYADKIVRSLLFNNDVALYVPEKLKNSGEAMSLTDADVFNNAHAGVEDHSNFEWLIQGTSFDNNATALQIYGATVHAVNCHFEQDRGPVLFEPYGMGSISIRDSEILLQAPGGADDKYVFSTWPQALNLVVDDVSVWSNHPVRYFMHMQGDVTGRIANLYGNGNRKIAAFSDDPARQSLQPRGAF